VGLVGDCSDEEGFVGEGWGEGEGHVELLEFGVGDDGGHVVRSKFIRS
jgi:hypothetical protein